MANNPPASPIDERVLARRQKDLQGFLDKHQEILDKRVEQYGASIRPVWEKIARNISDEIKLIYNEVQDAQGVPITKQPIKKDKLRNMKRQIKRLEKLQQQLVDMLGTEEQKAVLDRTLTYSYAESYYYHIFALEQAAKVTVAAPILTLGHVVGAVINPWLPDGNTYSSRIRANASYLAKKMESTVLNALGSGWSINRTAREIQNNANEGFYSAVRLARTEMNRAAAQGASHTYMQNADILDGKRWNATLDSKTAPKDAQNDGNMFPLEYDTPEHPGEPGKRIPNHPNCRCKWTPILSALGISAKERIARDKDGERIYTKARSYKEYAKERGLPDVDGRVVFDDPRGYLRRGETLKDIPANFYDPFEPVKSAFGNFTAVAAAATPIVEGFTAATSIEEANAWAAENLTSIKEVDYTGYNLQLANEVNEELYKLTQLYPEVEDINYVGTIQQRNRLMYEWEKEEFLRKNAKVFADKDQETIDYYLKKYVKRRKAPSNNYAQATNKTWGPQAGITFNEKWAKDYSSLKRAVENDVKSGWHPVGTEKPVSILIHEFGHSIDYFLDKIGLRDKYITPITKEFFEIPFSIQREEALSRYAEKNDREVVAEAFAEYRLNPNPRKFARKIGEAIEQALDEYRKGRK